MKIQIEYGDEEVKIYADKDGLSFLKQQIDSILSLDTDHFHLMSESWGGDGAIFVGKAFEKEKNFAQHLKITFCEKL